jgi:lipopolysaccharide/colanic/teichoic acid biosynthesis glycosyltransferase
MSSTPVASGFEGTKRGTDTQATAATPNRHMRAIPWSKRIVDLMVAISAFGVAAPIMVVAAILVRLTSPGPALYRQTRIGQGEQPFTMFKLRTMYVGSDDSAYREFNTQEILGNADPGTSDGIFKLEHDPRITRVGRFLRRLSIDELPQLWNVIRGEMSLVGPRPLLPWEVELFTSEQRRRHDCAPGITGLWQVSGRSRLSTPEMLALDIAYVERQSLLFDLWILLRTPWAVLSDKGVR